MKMFSIGLVGLSLLACGAKPGVDGEETGNTVVDADKDGFDASVDCDDSDADINPDADEICDGLDNNCDDEIDEATATDAGTWYADSDLDSYGDANTSMIACDMPEGYVEDSTDCDDTSELANPGAAEICDGIDNDCDASTSEDNMATHISTDGVASDVTADVSGADGAPAEFTVSDGGLHFCDGTFYVNLTVDGDATVGSLNEDPTQAILDGGGTGPVVQVIGDVMDVEISDLTFTGGEGLNLLPETVQAPSGGGLFCSSLDESDESLGDIKMDLSNVLITGNNSSFIAGGLFSIGCDLTINNSEISFNQSDVAVGGIMAMAGNHTLNGVHIVSNDASQSYAGGLFLAFDNGVSNADLTDVIVANNASLDVPGIGLQEGTYTWTGSAGARGSGVWKNTGVDTGVGALFLMDADFTADTVDLGVADSSSDNAFMDLTFRNDDGDVLDYVAGDDASFSCNGNECGTPVTNAVSDSVDYDSGNGSFFGNLIEASSTSTLMSFEMDSSEAASDCSMDFYLLKEMSSGSWEVLWSNTDVPLNASGNTNSGTIGVVVEDGERYVTGFKGACTSGTGNDDIGYDDSGSGSTDAGWGTAISMVGGDLTAEPITLGEWIPFPIFYMEFNHTQL